MNILAFDCAGPVLSVGLLADGAFFQTEADGGQKHSQLVMDMAEFLLTTSSLKKEDLHAAACMKGPGSFTGLRIGFAAAKGIASALGIPVVAIPTLDCMAYCYSQWPGIVMPVIDAKKSAYFTALYRNGKLVTPYLDAEVETIIKLLRENFQDHESPVLLTGPDAEKLFPLLCDDFPEAVVDPASRRGRVRELLELARKSITDGTVEEAVPMYLRKSDAELQACHEGI